MSKYKSKKVNYNGLQFDSKFECTYYVYLKQKETEGEISNLQRQQEYRLIPRQTDSKGKFLYHPIDYVSDFEFDANGEHHTIDTKGMPTPDFRLKQKLFYYIFKRQIECVKLKDAKRDPMFKEIEKKMKVWFTEHGV